MSQQIKKCAHVPCQCDVPAGQEYCSEACPDAGRQDLEIACQCGHRQYPLVS